jgi:hypothetical protein
MSLYNAALSFVLSKCKPKISFFGLIVSQGKLTLEVNLVLFCYSCDFQASHRLTLLMFFFSSNIMQKERIL